VSVIRLISHRHGFSDPCAPSCRAAHHPQHMAARPQMPPSAAHREMDTAAAEEAGGVAAAARIRTTQTFLATAALSILTQTAVVRATLVHPLHPDA
jgi:hypothetical protein